MRNLLVLMSSQLGTWGLAVIAALIVPRLLGADQVGRFHLANSLWALGAVVIAFGMNLEITKQVARSPGSIGRYLSASVAARVLITLPVAAVIVLYAAVAQYPRQVLILLPIVGAGVVATSLSEAVAAVLQGLDRMGKMSIALVAGRLVFVGGAVALLLAGFNVYAVAAVAATGASVTLVIQLIALHSIRRDLGDTSWPLPRPDVLGELLRASLPYLWIALSIVLYQQVDTIALSLLVESDDVLGWYSVYETLAGTMMFIPGVFMMAVFPTLSRMYEQPDGEARRTGGPTMNLHPKLTQKTFEAMLLISVPIGLGCAAISEQLIRALFGGDFAGAAPIVMVGGVVVSLTYQTTMLGMFLIAMDRQREWTMFITLGALLTIPLDIALVPLFDARYGNGAVGAALGYVVTESIVLCGALYLLPRGSLGRSSVGYATRAIFAGLVMVAAVVPLRNVNVLLAIAVGAAVYLAMVFVLRLVSPDDRRLVVAQIRRSERERDRADVHDLAGH